MAISEIREAAFENGVWQAEAVSVEQPDVLVYYLGAEVADVDVQEVDTNLWEVSVPIPSAAVGDGVHTFVVQERGVPETLISFTLMAGSPVANDLRAEMSLMRQELDLLKRAFRRYVSEKG